jgi:DNA-binding transcriptional LysR family regulator
MQRRRNAEDHRALHLRLDGIRVDDAAAIHRAHHALDPDAAVVRHLDLGDLRHVAAEHVRAELVAEDIAEGRLQALLSNYKIQSRPRHIVWLENRRMTPKLRAFIDFVAGVYG